MWEAKLYTGDKFIGKIVAKSLTALKRMASRKCNGYFQSIDTMVLHGANDKEIDGLMFTRINRKIPNNTIIRGEWN